MEIGEKIKSRRKELGLTMLEVAQKSNVSEATVSRWESGNIANMRRDKIVLLANALNVPPSYIMEWDISPFAVKLKFLRENSGYSMDKLAKLYTSKFDKVMTSNKINDYESGTNSAPFSVIENFAKLFNVTTDYIMSDVFDDDLDTDCSKNVINAIPINSSDIIKLPVYGKVSAGNGMYAEDNIIDYENVDKNDVIPGEEYYYLKICGDSMYPIFMDGDYVLVKKQTSVDSGSYAVVLVDDEEGFVKKVVYDSNLVELLSINPMYPPRRFENENVLKVRVQGLVKGMKRKF